MRSSTKTRPNIRPNIRTNPDRRYSARYLILVYHGTRAHFDPLEIQRLVAGEQAKCTIVRQSEDDNIFNYFAFIDFSGKRFQTRNLAFFDIQQYHPKWIHVTSSPWQKLDEMMAQGDVLWNGIDRPNKRPSADRRKHATGKPPSSGQWELLGSVTDEASFEELLRKEMSRNESESEDPLIEDFEYEVNPEDGQTEMARNVQYWQDGYRAGYKAATSKFAAHQTPDKNFSKFSTSDIPYSDKVGRLFSPNGSDILDAGGSTSHSLSHLFTQTDTQIQTEASQIDWNLELDDVWNNQRAR